MIQRGDTLYKLSDYFDVSVDELLAANPYVNPNNLYIGQPIRIPISSYLYQKYPWYFLFPYRFIRFPRNYWNDRRRWPRRQPGGDGRQSWPDRDRWPDMNNCPGRDCWSWPEGGEWADRDEEQERDRDRDGR